MLDDPVEATRKLAPHVFATHIKDLLPVKGVSVKEWYYFSSVAAGTGLVQIKEIAQILNGSGYQGFLAFETDMPHPDYEGRGREDDRGEHRLSQEGRGQPGLNPTA